VRLRLTGTGLRLGGDVTARAPAAAAGAPAVPPRGPGAAADVTVAARARPLSVTRTR
jgi:hypothetical protein